MIQRIQSIYLLLAGVSNGILIFFLPLFIIGGVPRMILDDPTFLIMTVLSTLVSLFSIFRYRNRQQQVVSGRINIILNFVLFGLMLFMFFTLREDNEIMFHAGTFVPILSVILISLANRAILKDEALVRSADRLR
jgi:hypothetical protein